MNIRNNQDLSKSVKVSSLTIIQPNGVRLTEVLLYVYAANAYTI